MTTTTVYVSLVSSAFMKAAPLLLHQDPIIQAKEVEVEVEEEVMMIARHRRIISL